MIRKIIGVRISSRAQPEKTGLKERIMMKKNQIVIVAVALGAIAAVVASVVKIGGSIEDSNFDFSDDLETEE